LQLTDAKQEIERLKLMKTKVGSQVETRDYDSKIEEIRTDGVVDKPPMTDLQEQQLARYTHFITCPACKVFDQSTPRNQVVVPCGHLLCTKCTGGDLKTCPLCQSPVEGLQTLVIG